MENFDRHSSAGDILSSYELYSGIPVPENQDDCTELLPTKFKFKEELPQFFSLWQEYSQSVEKENPYEYLKTISDIEVENYIQIFKKNNFEELYQVNEFITQEKLWDYFPKIRSLNQHVKGESPVQGIQPLYFAQISQQLAKSEAGAHGSKLISSTSY